MRDSLIRTAIVSAILSSASNSIGSENPTWRGWTLNCENYHSGEDFVKNYEGKYKRFETKMSATRRFIRDEIPYELGVSYTDKSVCTTIGGTGMNRKCSEMEVNQYAYIFVTDLKESRSKVKTREELAKYAVAKEGEQRGEEKYSESEPFYEEPNLDGYDVAVFIDPSSEMKSGEYFILRKYNAYDGKFLWEEKELLKDVSAIEEKYRDECSVDYFDE